MRTLRQRSLAATLLVTGLIVGAAPLAAQRGARPAAAAAPQVVGRPIRFATDVQDSIRATDLKISGRGGFRTYRFEARADKRYIITMNAPDFDAYVWVARQVGGLTEEIASDDDGGSGEGGTNARLRFKAPVNGSYTLVTQSLSEEGVGPFTVRVEEIAPPPPAVAHAITIGQTIEGAITENSPRLEDDGDVPHDLYSIRGKGQRVRIAMTAEFDTYLQVMKITNGTEEEVGTDDDSGGGTNSRIIMELNGDYRIIARPLGGNPVGPYTLSVTESVEAVVRQRPIEIGQTIQAELTAEDPELEDGGYFQEFVVTANAGDQLRITMRSGEFDSYLRWGTKSGSAFTEIASDDDSGGDLDSQISVRVETSGRYVIRISALESNSVGPYTLTLERGAP